MYIVYENGHYDKYSSVIVKYKGLYTYFKNGSFLNTRVRDHLKTLHRHTEVKIMTKVKRILRWMNFITEISDTSRSTFCAHFRYFLKCFFSFSFQSLFSMEKILYLIYIDLDNNFIVQVCLKHIINSVRREIHKCDIPRKFKQYINSPPAYALASLFLSSLEVECSIFKPFRKVYVLKRSFVHEIWVLDVKNQENVPRVFLFIGTKIQV